MTTLEVLKNARDLISDPNRWCQQYHARKADGCPTSICSPEACRRCARGAVLKAGRFDLKTTDYAMNRLYRAGHELFDSEISIAEINDEMGHEAILKCFDRAIQNLEQ